ncbi:hypothetical protein AAMO2058_001731200 [Amorphochlora amoebiformis]
MRISGSFSAAGINLLERSHDVTKRHIPGHVPGFPSLPVSSRPNGPPEEMEPKMTNVTTTVQISNPSVSEVSDLFNQGFQPYCECSNPLIQRSSIANISFVYDTLCDEIELVWPQVESTSLSSVYWDMVTLRSVLEALYAICSSVDRISFGTVNNWKIGYFTSLTLLDEKKLKALIEPENVNVRDSIITQVNGLIDISEVFAKSNMIVGYATDAIIMPTTFKEDPWATFDNISDVNSGTIVSLSKLASIYRNSSITAENFDDECPDGTEGNSTSNDFEEYGALVDIVSNGKLQGTSPSSGGYTYDLTYYCSATRTLREMPTAALADSELMSWAGLDSPIRDALGTDAMSQSSFQNISSAIEKAFIEDSTISFNYNDYFSSCKPSKCSFVKNAHLSATAVVVIIFGLLGGFISTLQIIIPVLFAPCAPDDDKLDEENNKEIEMENQKAKNLANEVKGLKEEVRRLTIGSKMTSPHGNMSSELLAGGTV